jgi:tetraacyldisaccharide 4'-kinase
MTVPPSGDQRPPSMPGSWADRIQSAWLGRGPLAITLWPLSLAYRAAIGLREGLYRLGLKATETLPVPVLVVGNLVAGGAGKTPTTLALVELLRRRGYTPGVISRGHGRRAQGIVQVTRDTPVEDSGDEPLLIHLRAGVPVAVGRDRVAAGRSLLARHPRVDLLLSDDGLQHRRLHRDAQVIVFDERGAGNGWLLPAGPLREPFAPARVPARSVVLYNAAEPSTAWPGHRVRRRLGGAVALAAWWQGSPASREALVSLAGRPVLAAAGVARPGRFFGMLREAGLDIAECPLPDHHGFADLPWPADTPDVVVVTEKDAVKLRPDRPGCAQVQVATLDFAFDADFEAELMRCLPPPRSPFPLPTSMDDNDPHGHSTA